MSGREWSAEDVRAEVEDDSTPSLMSTLEPALADSKEWTSFEGPRGGEGWRSRRSGGGSTGLTTRRPEANTSGPWKVVAAGPTTSSLKNLAGLSNKSEEQHSRHSRPPLKRVRPNARTTR